MDRDKRTAFCGHKNNKEKGFTLVELIVVLVIIVILAGLFVPALFGMIDNARNKELIAQAQTALSATQAALSDIYSSNDNKYTIAKREQTRINAGAAADTAFTVWNVCTLYDEPDGDNPATIAVTDQIGSYTVGKALYEDESAGFVMYNGTEWDVFDTKAEALAALALTVEEEPSIIHVWPYNPDFALMEEGPADPDPGDEDPDQPDVLLSKTVTLLRNPKNRAYFTQDGADTNDGVTVTFYQDEDGSITTDWEWKEGQNSFTKAAQTILLSFARTYIFRFWQEQDGDYTAKTKSQIANYIFGEDKEGVDHFVFVAQVMRDPNLEEVATLSNSLFRAFSNKHIKDMVQVEDESYTVEYVKNSLRATKVDDGATDCSIYAWYEGNTIKWWTDALVAYMPENCDSMMTGKNMAKFSFRGFDVSKMKSAEEMFSFCKQLKEIDFGDEFVAPNLTNLKRTFRDMEGIKSLDLSGIQELGATVDLEETFRYLKVCDELKLGDVFKKSKPVNLAGTFRDCITFQTLDVSAMDVSQAVSCDKTFLGCTNLQTINFGEQWNLAECTTMYGMFFRCKALNQDMHELTTGNKLVDFGEVFSEDSSFVSLDLRGIDPSNVENFRSTFKEMGALTSVDISTWKGAKRPNKVRVMRQMFSGDKLLESIDVSGWNLSDLENFSHAFANCQRAQINVEGWNEAGLRPVGGKLYSVQEAFINCYVTTGVIDLSDWDVSGLSGPKADYGGQTIENVSSYDGTEDAKNMFAGCQKIEGIKLRNWDLSLATNLGNFFNGCSSVKELDLSGWKVGTCTMTNGFFNGCKNSLEVLKLENAQLNTLTSCNTLFRNCSKLQKVYMKGFTAPKADSAGWMFENCRQMEYADLSKAKLPESKTMQGMFKNCEKLIEVSLSEAVLGKAESMKEMFNSCKLLERVDLSGLDTSYVTDMSYLFSNCNSLVWVNMTNMNTAMVKDMSYMFNACKSIETISLSTMNVAKLENMSHMFYSCTALKSLDLSGLNSLNVTDMQYMCAKCEQLNDLKLSGFNTQSVTTMTWMFAECKALETVDVSSFSTSNVWNFGDMFNSCTSMKRLDLSSFDVSNATYLTNVVKNLSSLEYLNLSGWKMVKMEGNGALKSDFLGQSKSSLQEVDFSNADFGPINNMANMFRDYKALKKVNLKNAKADQVTSLYWMFSDCVALESVDMSGFSAKEATNLEKVFHRCRLLKTIKLAGADLSAATRLVGMFEECNVLDNLDLSGVAFSSVTNMGWMFKRCYKLTGVDLSDMTMGNVTDTNNMFESCTLLEKVRLAKDFDGSAVTKCVEMFKACTALEEIGVYAEDASISRYNNTKVFEGCNNIKGGAGTSYQGNGALYGRVDAEGAPGYFTYIAE